MIAVPTLAPESGSERSLGRTDLTHLSAAALAELIARGEISALDVVEAHVERIERVNSAAYAALYNVLGYPRGVVSVTRVREAEELGRRTSRDMVRQAAYSVERGSAGLPIGVQVAARPWREHVALAAMRAIEEAARAKADFPATPVALTG